MTTTTDLLRRAAELLRRLDHEEIETSDVAASLLALADQMERAEPVAVVGGQRRGWYYLSGRPSVSIGTKLYTHPAPEVTRDAERYRWLRDGNATERGEPWAITRYAPGDGRNRDGGTCPLAGDELDAAVDAAMLAASDPRQQADKEES